MFPSWRIILFIILIAFLSACSFHRQAEKSFNQPDDLIKELEAIVSDPNLHNAQIGIYIESLDDGRALYRHNEHKLFIPASNMKLFTTAAALVTLGPEWRYQTRVLSEGDVSDSILHGNLIVSGQGDPAISGRFHNNDALAIFKTWADSLRSKGVKRIEGDLLGDDSFFKGDRLGEGWQWDDESYYYSAQTAALSFNDNCVDISVIPGKKTGDAAIVQLDPATDYVTVINSAKTAPADSAESIRLLRRRAQNIIDLDGRIPVSADTQMESISIENPPLYFLSALRQTLINHGIEIKGNISILPDSELARVKQATLLFRHSSPAVSELIKVINKSSHNLYAEQLIKTMGAIKRHEGSFTAGTQYVSEWMNSVGIAPAGLIMADGSGLSRMNMVSPAAVATLLRFLYHHKYFESYYDSLPIAGVDGTLIYRMNATAAQGNVRAKTGFVRYARNLSGFIKDSRQRPYLFALLFNNFSTPVAYINAIQDRICVLLSNYR
jgi:D-alanyl-D-alanine carboxypeptidase/D-alanyl-D-alanine-endopeptidase (penicillin-binding protein 4)